MSAVRLQIINFGLSLEASTEGPTEAAEGEFRWRGSVLVQLN